MEEIIKNFGIDWRLISSQIFNFAILAVALWYFLYTPVLSMIEKRRQTIEKGLTDAAEAGRSRKDAEKEKAEIVKTAHDEASLIAARNKFVCEEKARALMSDAEERSLRTLEDAKKAGIELQDRLYKESEAEIARTALLAAEKILKARA